MSTSLSSTGLFTFIHMASLNPFNNFYEVQFIVLEKLYIICPKLDIKVVCDRGKITPSPFEALGEITVIKENKQISYHVCLMYIQEIPREKEVTL